MKKGIIIALVLAAIVGGFFMFSEPADETTATKSEAKVAQITSFAQVSSAVSKGGQLLDVRTAEEFAAGHIDGAINFPLQDLQAGKEPTGTKTQSLFVYCHSGNRSNQATTILKGSGFESITDLGAITHVQSLGGKLVTGS